MSPKNGGAAAQNNIYTVIIGLAFFVVLSTAVFVAYQCYDQYGTIFTP